MHEGMDVGKEKLALSTLHREKQDIARIRPHLGQPSTTPDIYSHAFDENQKEASQALQNGLEI